MNIAGFSEDAFAGYVAALLDGEGSIEIHPKECGIRIRIANTFKPVLDAICERLGYGRVEAYPKRPTLPLFAYRTSNAHDCRALLTFCRPFIQIKADRADRALQIISRMQDRADEVFARNREILAGLARGERQTVIALRVGVTQSYVSYVKTHGLVGSDRLNPKRSLKARTRPSEALFTNHGLPLSSPCRPPSESSDQSRT